MSEINTMSERPDPELILRASAFSTATLLEAGGKKGALPSAIKPIAKSMKLCGPAVTVSSPPHDNIMLHRAIYAAKAGDVLLVEVSGQYEAGYWGDIMTTAALQRSITGLVIDGNVRDGDDIEASGFPVFARGLCIRGTGKNGGGTINEPIQIGDVTIHPGDVVVGDRDGVVVIPKSALAHVLAEAEKREALEERVRNELKHGKSTLEIYGWV